MMAVEPKERAVLYVNRSAARLKQVPEPPATPPKREKPPVLYDNCNVAHPTLHAYSPLALQRTLHLCRQHPRDAVAVS